MLRAQTNTQLTLMLFKYFSLSTRTICPFFTTKEQKKLKHSHFFCLLKILLLFFFKLSICLTNEFSFVKLFAN